MKDKKFVPFWMEKEKIEIIEAYAECIHNGEVLLERIEKAIEYISSNCILSREWEEVEFCKFLAIETITYKSLSRGKIKELLNILKGEE